MNALRTNPLTPSIYQKSQLDSPVKSPMNNSQKNLKLKKDNKDMRELIGSAPEA